MISEAHPINEDAWEEWVEFRHKEKKIKIGPVAEKKQRKMLAEYPPPIQQQIIDNSIMNSYQGLFPPKGNGNGQNQLGHENTRRLSAVERVREAQRRSEGAGQGQIVASMERND
jgi:hypothetical protein